MQITVVQLMCFATPAGAGLPAPVGLPARLLVPAELGVPAQEKYQIVNVGQQAIIYSSASTSSLPKPLPLIRFPRKETDTFLVSALIGIFGQANNLQYRSKNWRYCVVHDGFVVDTNR